MSEDIKTTMASPPTAVPLLGSKPRSLEESKQLKTIARDPRVAEFIQKTSDALKSENLQQIYERMKPVFFGVLAVLRIVFGCYLKMYRAVYAVYAKLPADEIQLVLGFILCFFGGFYVTLIAAVEAFRTMGGQSLYDDLEYVALQIKLVIDANDEDQKMDADKDGRADVDDLNATEMFKRKAIMAMANIEEPKRLQCAVGSLWAACISVLATLKLEFAQTAAYALAISDLVHFPVTRLCSPLLTLALGPDLVRWVDVIIDSALKGVVILLVWFFAKIRAAFYSGMRGGKMFGAATVRILQKRGLTDSLPDSIVAKPFDPEKSYLDEVIGYSLAAVGFYFQVTSFFLFLPFPLDWILWPVTLLEQFLEIQVTWA